MLEKETTTRAERRQAMTELKVLIWSVRQELWFTSALLTIIITVGLALII